MQVEITIYFIRNIEWEIGLVVGNYMYIYYISIYVYISIYQGTFGPHYKIKAMRIYFPKTHILMPYAYVVESMEFP